MDCKSHYFKLLSGYNMPLIGFGTFQITGRQLIKDVLDWAFAAGYRSIDTATVYGNEHDIGLALKDLLPKYKLKREDIFITSKLSPGDHGQRAYESVSRSIKNLQCGYLDLYLIHWPGASGISKTSTQNVQMRQESWLSLIKARNDGLVRDIGVSNYTLRHLIELLKNCNGVKPSVNQVEWHPACYQPELKDLCQNEGILLEAYSSLGGTNNPILLEDPTVNIIAKNLGKSAAQVLLRWALQQNIRIIPKARNKQRIEANIDLNFVIPEEYMSALSNKNEQTHFAWNPNCIV